MSRKFTVNQTIVIENTQLGVHKCNDVDVKNSIESTEPDVTHLLHGWIRDGGYCLDNTEGIQIWSDYESNPNSQYVETLVMRC